MVSNFIVIVTKISHSWVGFELSNPTLPLKSSFPRDLDKGALLEHTEHTMTAGIWRAQLQISLLSASPRRSDVR